MSSGVKTVYLVRHGQAEHNVLWDVCGEKAVNTRDAALTETGRKQAQGLKRNPVMFKALHELAGFPRPEVCVTSPLTRTVETATIGLGGMDIPFVACEHLQECSDLPCDTGIHPSELTERFPEVDFSTLPEEWFLKTGHYNFLTKRSSEEGQRLLWQRMEAATEYLCSRPETTIAVSAHHTVFNFLVGVEFRNCEVYRMELALSGRWQKRWRVVEADGEVIPLLNKAGEPFTWTGSGPLKGTLRTCLSMTYLGQEAARLSYERHLESVNKSDAGFLDGLPTRLLPLTAAAFAIGLALRR